MLFEKVECLTNTYKSGSLRKDNVYIKKFISYLNQYCEIIFFSSILANKNLPLNIYCESIVKIL